MAEARSATGPGWIDTLAAQPLGWFGVFVALSLVLVGAMLAWWSAFGFWPTLFDASEPLGISFDGRSHLTQAVLLAFVAASSFWIRLGVMRDMERMGASAGVPAAEIARAIDRNWRPSRAVRASLLGAALAIGYGMSVLTTRLEFLRLDGWDMHYVWGLFNNVALFFLMLEGAWLALESWRTTDRFMQRHLAVDLLDRREIASIGRIGGRAALVWLVGGTIASFMTWGMERAAPIYIVLAILLAFATLSFVLPAWLARGALVEAKQRELGRVRDRIAQARDGMFAESGAGAAERASLLQGLLAYEARIESVPDWPYDPSTLIRFAVLALIATGSWLGGALVERALSVVLD